jgi:hypothetical protein
VCLREVEWARCAVILALLLPACCSTPNVARSDVGLFGESTMLIDDRQKLERGGHPTSTVYEIEGEGVAVRLYAGFRWA